MSRIGILGGTFNPIHTVHLLMAEKVKEQLKLKKVLFIPANIPPHKTGKNLASARHRYQMVRLAVKGNPAFAVSDYEIKKQGKSYTIDTLEYLKKKYSKNTKFFFIIGGDTLGQLKTWKRFDDIRKIVSFVAINRPAYIYRGRGFKYSTVTIPGVETSSSYLRKQIAQRKSIKYLVPEDVIKYIKRHNLYRKKSQRNKYGRK